MNTLRCPICCALVYADDLGKHAEWHTTLKLKSEPERMMEEVEKECEPCS